MSRYVMGVSDDLQEECHSYILHDNMNIPCIMVHAQQMEATRAMRKSRDAKMARSFMLVFQRVGLIQRQS